MVTIQVTEHFIYTALAVVVSAMLAVPVLFGREAASRAGKIAGKTAVLAIALAAILGLLYLLVRFIRWAWDTPLS